MQKMSTLFLPDSSGVTEHAYSWVDLCVCVCVRARTRAPNKLSSKNKMYVNLRSPQEPIDFG